VKRAYGLLACLLPSYGFADASVEDACRFYNDRYFVETVSGSGATEWIAQVKDNSPEFHLRRVDLERFATLVTDEVVLPVKGRSSSGARQAISMVYVCYADITSRSVLWLASDGGPSAGQREIRSLPNESGDMANYPFEINALPTETLKLEQTIEGGRF